MKVENTPYNAFKDFVSNHPVLQYNTRSRSSILPWQRFWWPWRASVYKTCRLDPQGSRRVSVSHQSQSPPISAKRRFIDQMLVLLSINQFFFLQFSCFKNSPNFRIDEAAFKYIKAFLLNIKHWGFAQTRIQTCIISLYICTCTYPFVSLWPRLASLRLVWPRGLYCC